MDTMKNGVRSTETRARLLEAAGETFADHGFRDATVREIARRAGVNVAAVNYYYGDKEGLYSAVLKYTLESALKKYPPDLGLEAGATAEDRLHAFIRSLLYRVTDEGRPAWHGKLMMREVAQPTRALDEMVDSAVRPLHASLFAIVREIAGAGGAGDEMDEEGIRNCALSIIGQCLFYHLCRPVLRVIYAQTFDAPEIERLAVHITRFSLQGLKVLTEKKGGDHVG
jgi:TetR/AcrR family transcriptional regulator, regulator of cefoperazone and chloramphenicol sensitivity